VKIKKCPFCGNNAFPKKEDYFEGEYWTMMCDGLDCIMRHMHNTKKEAIRAWNKRQKEE